MSEHVKTEAEETADYAVLAASAYDAMKADPSRGLSVDCVFAEVKDRHAARVKTAKP